MTGSQDRQYTLLTKHGVAQVLGVTLFSHIIEKLTINLFRVNIASARAMLQQKLEWLRSKLDRRGAAQVQTCTQHMPDISLSAW
jgi:hypothetical protein